MKIIDTNEALGTILYSCFDYKHTNMYVVVYGLTSTTFDDMIQAYDYLNSCKCHALCVDTNYNALSDDMED